MIRQENIWFEESFDALDQSMMILDKDGRIIRINRGALQLMGLPLSAVFGIPLWTVPWPQLSKLNRAKLKNAFARAVEGISVSSEFEIRLENKIEKIIDFSFKPVQDEWGLFKFMIVEGRDITDYRRTSNALSQSEARFKTIFEEAGIGIVIKAENGMMLECNPAFQAMVGYTGSELRERDYLDIIHPHDKAGSRKLFNEMIAGKRRNYFIEKRYISRDGQIVWGRMTASLVRGQNGEENFVIGMVENITANKQIQADLDELQHRLMQGKENERLRLAQDLHDGPLQEIIGVSYQVQELENSIQEETRVEQLHAIRAALQQLTWSVRSICGELRPPTLVPFGLEKTILSHVEKLRTAHPELSVTYKLAHDGLSLPENMRITLFRIYQEAINNILRHAHANAIKIRFRLNSTHAILEIQDDGLGFELPDQWVNLARQGHLGLVGAVERAREVGGTLEVIPVIGQGTKIKVSVPLKGEGACPALTGRRSSKMSAIRVLLADDHPVVRGGIRALLENTEEMDVVGEASTGSEALTLAETLQPDVLLLDLELPDIEGIYVAQQIRQQFPDVKILALSAHDDAFYIRGVLESGAAGYLMKDEAPDMIVEAIKGVARGDKGWVSRRISAQITSWVQSNKADEIRLTPREERVLSLVVEGRTNQAIAAQLMISEKTVEKYMAAIFEKLKVASRVEAAVYAVREGLIKPE